MNTGLLHSLLDAQPSTPAGELPLKVVMIDRKNIIVNPDNRKIYVIGDVSRLKEDIRVHGIRQPLEVVDLENGDYKLIGGERRLTACEELAKEGDTRFNALPCVILRLKQDDDDKIALITANATARELTDGERLAQYEALKEILTRRKKNGQLEGKVRDELCRILGLSAGAAARLNVISSCENEIIKERLKSGEIGLMEAYRSAQDYARFMGKADEPQDVKEEPECKTAQNADAAVTAEESAAQSATAETLIISENEEDASASTNAISRRRYESAPAESAGDSSASLPSSTSCPETIPENPDFDEWKLPPECRVAVEKAHREAAEKQEEQQREKKTLKKLAEKMIDEDAPWELEQEDVRFWISYYKQPLPGGATLWKQVDVLREDAGQPCDNYAIILQDGKFFTCGWIPKISVIAELVRYFVLK